MRQIPITRGLFTLVDDDDFERLSNHKWYAQPRGNNRFYAARRDASRRTLVYMHRVVHNTADGAMTDHIDGNGLNNQRSNLRTVTVTQNAMNAQRQTGKRFKGSWYDASNRNKNKWRAAIRLNGKLKYLGRFATEELAADAYAKAAEKYFGEYRRVNP